MPSIIPVKGDRGQEQARCTCDECGADLIVAAAHGTRGDFARKMGAGRNGFAQVPLRNEGQVITKLQSAGWSYVKRVLRCPACEANRKAKDEPEMATQPAPQPTVTAIRQPTQKQIRLIILALEDAYDDTAKRYKATNTDKTVALDLGDGIMPAWVAEQREKLFGPAGNEEADIIRAEIEKIRKEFSDKLDALAKRLDLCVKAHDKRVG
jgi:hypothetical protein